MIRAPRPLDRVADAGLWVALAVGLLPLAGIAWFVAGRLPAVWSAGPGLAAAVRGSLFVLGIGMAVAVPTGVCGGIWVAEVRGGWLAWWVRLSAELLAGAPGVIVGYAALFALVDGLGWGFGTAAGGLALAAVMLPQMVRDTAAAVAAVPDRLRDASLALGVDRRGTAWRLVVPAAAPRILAGVLNAVGVGIGETAALACTLGWTGIGGAGRSYLTRAIWAAARRPDVGAAALVVVVAVVLVARALSGVAGGGGGRGRVG